METKKDKNARLGDSKESGPEVPGDLGRTKYPKDENSWWEYIAQQEESLKKSCKKLCPQCGGSMMAKFNATVNKTFFVCQNPECSFIGVVGLLDILGYEGCMAFLEWQKKNQEEKVRLDNEEIKRLMLQDRDEGNRLAAEEWYRTRGVDENFRNRVQAEIVYESLKTKALYRRIYQSWENTDPTPEGHA